MMTSTFCCIGEDLLVNVLARVPYDSHNRLRVTCHRFKVILSSPIFLLERKRFREQLVFVAGGSDRNYRNECFTFTSGNWNYAPNLVIPCDSANLVVAGEDNIFLIGGRVGLYDAIGTVHNYTVTTNTWCTCKPLKQARFGAVAGFFCGSIETKTNSELLCEKNKGVDGNITFLEMSLIIVAGGFYDEDELDSVELLNFRTGEWITVEPMPYQTSYAAAEIIDGRFFVAGGTGEAGNKLQVWCPLQRTWKLLAEMPDARQSAASIVMDGKLHLIGGITGIGPSASVIVYDPNLDEWYEEWSLYLPMNLRRFGCSAVGPLSDDSFILVGGGDPLRFCRKTQEWSLLPDLPIGEIQWPGVALISF